LGVPCFTAAVKENRCQQAAVFFYSACDNAPPARFTPFHSYLPVVCRKIRIISSSPGRLTGMPSKHLNFFFHFSLPPLTMAPGKAIM